MVSSEAIIQMVWNPASVHTAHNSLTDVMHHITSGM